MATNFSVMKAIHGRPDVLDSLHIKNAVFYFENCLHGLCTLEEIKLSSGVGLSVTSEKYNAP